MKDPASPTMSCGMFIQGKKANAGKGTGSGLAICDHIIKAHGGQIWAGNAKPHGGAFAFVISGGDAEGRAIDIALHRCASRPWAVR